MSSGRAFDLALAGLAPLRLEPDSHAWREALAPRYEAFLEVPSPVPPAVNVVLRATSPAPDAQQLARQLAEPVTVERSQGCLAISASWCRITIEVGAGERVAVEVSGPLHRAVVDLALRHFLTERLADGLLLHGALLADGGRLFLCSGPSGCGKTTLAELLPGAALCDELAVARRDAAGVWTAWSLPYWQGRPGSGRLAGILLLAHGERSERRPLAAAAALRRLAPEVLWPVHDEAASERALGLLGALAGEVPVATLAFRPEPSVWKLISGMDRGVAA